MKKIGFFKELLHGEITGQSLVELKNTGNYEVGIKIKTLNYLKSGEILVMSPKVIYDYFDPDKIIDTLYILTDGVWVWPSDFQYYFDIYNLTINEEFIHNAQSNNWEIPKNIDINNIIY